MVRHLSPVVTKAVAALVFGCALLALPARANAQTQPAPSGGLGQGFGDKGQLVISGEDFLGFDKVNHAGWTLTVKPALDYFLLPAISLGAVVTYIKQSGDASAVLVSPRVGYNLNVTDNLGAWLKIGFAYEHSSVGNASSSATFLTAYLPIMFHIVPHLFVGIGPYYNLKVSGTANSGYGFSSLVGGWF
jgi:hypothetical protein